MGRDGASARKDQADGEVQGTLNQVEVEGVRRAAFILFYLREVCNFDTFLWWPWNALFRCDHAAEEGRCPHASL